MTGLPEPSPLNSEAVVEIVEQARTGLSTSARLREAERHNARLRDELANSRPTPHLDRVKAERDEARRACADLAMQLAAAWVEIDHLRAEAAEQYRALAFPPNRPPNEEQA